MGFRKNNKGTPLIIIRKKLYQGGCDILIFMKISTLGLQIALVPNWLAELFHKNIITNLMLSLGTIEIVIRYNEESLIQHGINLWKVNII